MLILVYFISKVQRLTYITEPFGKKLGGSCVSFLFLGNNRKHMLVCAKRISSSVRKIVSIDKVHMSLDTLPGAVASAALITGVSLVFILQAGNLARVPTQGRHNFSACITTTD